MPDYNYYGSPAYIEKKAAQHRRRLHQRRRRIFLLVCLALILGAGLLLTVPAWVRGGMTKATGSTSTVKGNSRRFSGIGLYAFARVGGSNLRLYLPVEASEVEGIGYHQAYNPKAYELTPIGDFFPAGAQTKSRVSKAVGRRTVAFVMSSRGRRSNARSSVDIAVPAGSLIKSPVDGVVSDIVPYRLYGRYDDYRLELKAAGYPQYKIAMVHIENLRVRRGQIIHKGATILGTVRRLKVHSQINDYLSYSQDHVHIQVNPDKPKGK